MPMLGYVQDGKYVPLDPNAVLPVKPDIGMFKQGDHERQRKDYAKEVLQPYNNDGTPNEDFINVYPDIAKDKGMIPGDNNGQD